MNKNLDSFIIILYVGITLFFVYRLIKGQRSKVHLEGEAHDFTRATSSFEKILFAILLVTGVVNFYNGYRQGINTAMITAVVMIILAVVFALASRNKFYIAENGILVNSSFYNYKEIKKWGFDTEKADFVMQVKRNNQVSNEVVKVERDDIEEINTLIRKYKLNK